MDYLKDSYRSMFSKLLPSAIGAMLSETVASLIDAIILNHYLGPDMLSTISICMPIYMVINVLSMLIVSGGAARFERECPKLPPRTMRIGETIRFEPMKPYPQLELPSGSSVGDEVLHLRNDFSLSIYLPEHAEKLRLNIDLAVITNCDGDLTIRSDLAPPVIRRVGEYCYTFEENSFELPPSPEARQIDLRFGFRPVEPLPPRRIFRFRLRVGKIRLESVHGHNRDSGS